MPFPPGVGARGVGRGSDMPFPPGVGGGGGSSKQPDSSGAAVMGGAESESFEVITAEKALDANNVGNRMLRNMGWQEGSVCELVPPYFSNPVFSFRIRTSHHLQRSCPNLPILLNILSLLEINPFCYYPLILLLAVLGR